MVDETSIGSREIQCEDLKQEQCGGNGKWQSGGWARDREKLGFFNLVSVSRKYSYGFHYGDQFIFSLILIRGDGS